MSEQITENTPCEGQVIGERCYFQLNTCPFSDPKTKLKCLLSVSLTFHYHHAVTHTQPCEFHIGILAFPGFQR